MHQDNLQKVIRVERLGPQDMRQVMELEQLCFNYHWTEEQFRLGLEKGAFFVLGIRQGIDIVGYLAYTKVLDEMEILNLAVHPKHRRKGFAARLLSTLLARCREQGVRKGFLDVKASNNPAIDLYLKFGFKKRGVRRKYYPDTGEDAILLDRTIS
ncbi:MAG: ribosomal protein S18-alanine N-acetyltransferase [Proteobacteria bacterium]|nr:ribosomal protein S18-alanine N-acetyltransferase [Pseudomonadota bacterium]MBU1611705.1 ribosomal protein S18-alanine N-acetyltransferase [Pseudomonadota bacterium]